MPDVRQAAGAARRPFEYFIPQELARNVSLPTPAEVDKILKSWDDKPRLKTVPATTVGVKTVAVSVAGIFHPTSDVIPIETNTFLRAFTNYFHRFGMERGFQGMLHLSGDKFFTLDSDLMEVFASTPQFPKPVQDVGEFVHAHLVKTRRTTRESELVLDRELDYFEHYPRFRELLMVHLSDVPDEIHPLKDVWGRMNFAGNEMHLMSLNQNPCLIKSIGASWLACLPRWRLRRLRLRGL